MLADSSCSCWCRASRASSDGGLPILGAVPDGAIMLFSGLGPKEEPQEKLSLIDARRLHNHAANAAVGRIDLQRRGANRADGVAQYGRRMEKAGGLHSRGVANDSIRPIVRIFAATIYLIIQAPAFEYSSDKKTPNDTVAGREHWYALAGLIACAVAFCYLILMVVQSQSETKEYLINAAALKAIESEGADAGGDHRAAHLGRHHARRAQLVGRAPRQRGQEEAGKLLSPSSRSTTSTATGISSS